MRCAEGRGTVYTTVPVGTATTTTTTAAAPAGGAAV
jgi:hypothetical protein